MSQQAILDELNQLSIILDKIGSDYQLSELSEDILEMLQEHYSLPESYKTFLRFYNPNPLELRYSKLQTILFYPGEELVDAQSGYSHALPEWKSTWFVLGTFNDMPVFFALEEMEDETEDCAVYSVGASDNRVKVASSFLQFLQIARTSIEILGPRPEEGLDLNSFESRSPDKDYEDFEEDEEDTQFQYLLEDYYTELENIDPECVRAWSQG